MLARLIEMHTSRMCSAIHCPRSESPDVTVPSNPYLLPVKQPNTFGQSIAAELRVNCGHHMCFYIWYANDQQR